MDTRALPFVIFVSFLFACFVLALWVKEDAIARGKPGWLTALMVLSLGVVPGTLIWLVFRPPKNRQEP